jgi:hypothetical protein
MPAAGFWAIESHDIRFGRDGNWYSDGERIANPRIALLFSRSLRKRPEGGYQLQMGDERAAIEVEDTPFVVRRVDGDPDSGFSVVLNDESVEPLDPGTLTVGPDHALVCRVKGGEHEARFLRSAQSQLGPAMAEVGGGFALRTPDGDFPIRTR